MQINNLIETIRLKYNPEENIITIYNLNLHTERLLNSITELNFKINENSEKSLIFFSKDFYGNSYRPSLNLSDKTINDLKMKFIYKV